MMEAAERRTGHPRRSVGWVVAVLALVLAVFWRTALSMVEVWSRSDAYSHGFLVVPVFLWLVWDRRRTLAGLPISPFWPGLTVLAGLGLAWLIGELAAAPSPSQFAVAAMVPAAIATILGPAWARALAFPLAFLFFAVPFGESLVPTLMEWTADFTVAALKLSGVPVYREGNYFSLPSGDWSIIEACSGMGYVFACATVATLFAWTAYRSTPRRLLFVGAALGIAIAANWLRAYATVMAAHLSDNRLGTGRDHIVFAQVLFGVVTAAVLGLGTLWRETRPGGADGSRSHPTARPAIGVAPALSAPRRSAAAALAAVAILSVWPWLSLAPDHGPPPASGRSAPVEPRAGWVRSDEPAARWRPLPSNPSQVWQQSFTKAGHRVSVHVALFDRPSRQSRLTSSANRLVDAQDPQWKLLQRGEADVHGSGAVVPVSTATVAGREGQVTAWHWYWVDGTLTTSPARATLLQLFARLRGRSEASAWVAVYTTGNGATGPDSRVLEGFMTDMLASIDLALREAAGGGARPDRQSVYREVKSAARRTGGGRVPTAG